jgi:tetratricopeptide (TPR) repeat protein
MRTDVRVAPLAALIAVSLGFAAPVCFADVPGAATCPAGAHSAELDAARTALGQDERALDPRLKLADALLAQACYADAVHVLEEGEPLHPRNGAIQSRLRDARSMLSEQRYFDGLGRAEEAAKVQRNVLRCGQLGDLAACDEAVRAKPDDGSVVAAKADALIKANRPADALPAYRRALELAPSDASLQVRARDAETQRLALVAQCQNGRDDAALQACEHALLRGAGDEFSVQLRKAILLQGMEKPSQALDAYIAANLLKSGDTAVARGIVALTTSTGRNDALALAARGSALLALGRGAEAAKALRQAQQLSPSLPEVKLHLAAAEKLEQAEARKKVATDAAAKAAEAVKAQAELATANTLDASANAKRDRKYSNDGPASRSH